jgi:peptidoglycan/LPS O-acetylase OafA/YrhL
MARSDRLVGIDVLRAIAIITVLACHLRFSGFTQPPEIWIDSLAWILASAGGCGVILFFTISGFVITRTVTQRDGELSRMRAGAFYLRRVARLGPALGLSLALGVLMLSTAYHGQKAAEVVLFGNFPFTPAFWLSIATFTFNFEYAFAALTGHHLGLHWAILWSLSVEEQFYFLFPALTRLARVRTKFWVVAALLIVLSSFSRAAFHAQVPQVWIYPTPDCVDALVIGVTAAALPGFRLPRSRALCGAAFGLFVLGLGFLASANDPAWWTAKPLLIAIGAALIMLCCQNGAVFTDRLWLPFARIGRVSYGMYLFHPLMLYCLAPVLHGVPFFPALAMYVAMTTLVAEISFAAIERPLGRWILDRCSGPAAATHSLARPSVLTSL